MQDIWVGGSHVFNSSTESVCRGVSVERFFAEPKVCEHHVSLAIQHYVLRLQVSAREEREREREYIWELFRVSRFCVTLTQSESVVTAQSESVGQHYLF